MDEKEIKSINDIPICDEKARNELVKKIDKNQGNENAGKLLVVDENGYIKLSNPDDINFNNQYVLPIATSELLGGVKPVSKTSDMTKEVGVDKNGKLFVKEDITQEEITQLKNKSDFSGEWDDLKNKPTIPTELSSLNEDETHQTVTADEKKKWDSKSDFDGDFESLKNKPEIPDAVVVDAELSETSTNPIQNSVVAKELGKRISKGGLKTVNGQSLEGNGDISIEADVSLISRVEKTSDDTTVSLDPNTLYVFPEMTSLSISLNAPKDTTIVNEYHFIFESGATATTFSLPDNLKVDAYSIDANKIYEVSILESICYIRGVASA